MAIRRLNRRSRPREQDNKREHLGENTHGLEEKVDPATGKAYYELPSQYVKGCDVDNWKPTLTLTDLDLHHLEKEAEKYLPGRLRTAPSKEEMARLLAERKRMELLREQEYNAQTTELRAKREERNNKIKEKINKKMGA